MIRRFFSDSWLAVALAGTSGLSALACSSSDSGEKAAPKSSADETYLGLKAPEDGFQIRSRGMPIPAGQDLEFCEVAEFPGEVDDVYWVNRMEFANGKSSHHLIIDAAKDGGPAEERLASLEIGDRVPCISSQSQFGDGFEFVGGVQTPYRDLAYPAGVGRRFHGKQRFIFDYHYLNIGEETVQAQSAVNFHLTKEADVEHIAQIFNFNNTTIDTPPGGKASFIGECKVNADIRVTEITRHTHRWGREFQSWFSGGDRDGELVLTSPDYEHDVEHFFDTPVDLKAGEGFRFRCDFENTESHPLRFGPNATDEMCILFGLWWSETNDSPPSQDCEITQVGTDGIGRPASEGGFPEPTEEQVNSCKARATSSSVPECTDCTCGHCATVLEGCRGDPDCSVILDCIGTTGCRARGSCAEECLDVINAHSSALGAIIQVRECVAEACPGCSG